MDLVSVVIPIYNSEKYLKRCLDSVVKQSYQNLEILLINDGSTDGSGKICDSYSSNDERIKVFHNSNQGVSCARNCGIEYSTGKYLLFIDADDYVETFYVETLVDSLEKQKVDIVICGIKDCFEGNIRNRKARGEITGDFEKDYFNIIDFLCVSFSKIYINKIIQKQGIRFLKELNYAEDEGFNINYYRYIKSYTYTAKTFYVYEHHQNSLSDKDKFRDRAILLSYVNKLRMEKDFFDNSNIYKKEQIIGEQGMRAILYMADLTSYVKFVRDVREIRRNLYKNYIYDKMYKIIFATLLNLEIYLPLYLGCKLRDYLRNF